MYMYVHVAIIVRDINIVFVAGISSKHVQYLCVLLGSTIASTIESCCVVKLQATSYVHVCTCSYNCT